MPQYVRQQKAPPRAPKQPAKGNLKPWHASAGKIIMNFQYYHGDTQVEALCQLLADLEDEKRDDITFLFTTRFDSAHNERAIKIIRDKFSKVFLHKTTRPGIGWPHGPNSMYADSHAHCIDKINSGEYDADGIWFIEPDCIPLRKDYINVIKAEWQECVKNRRRVLGCWLEYGDCNTRHINGNCIIHKSLAEDYPEMLGTGSGGWDADFAHIMMPNGMPSKTIFSDYAHNTPDNPWRDCNHLFNPRSFPSPENPLHGQVFTPAWLHGVKGDAAIRCARDRLL